LNAGSVPASALALPFAIRRCRSAFAQKPYCGIRGAAPVRRSNPAATLLFTPLFIHQKENYFHFLQLHHTLTPVCFFTTTVQVKPATGNERT
jgi:hypothetical protein